MPLKAFDSKQPWEEYHVGFNFSALLGEDTIATASVSAIDLETGDDVTDTITDSDEQITSGSMVYVWVRSGSDGGRYRITCRVTSSSGSRWELDGLLPVSEV